MINDSKHVRKELTRILRKTGCKLTSLKDRERTYLGEVEKNGHKYILKLAKTKKGSLRLSNDVVFNKAVRKQNPPFVVPEIVNSGNVMNDFYFKLEENLAGTPFAILKKGISHLQVKDPESHFSKIIKMVEWLQEKKIVLPSSFDQQLHAFHKKDKHGAINTMISWSYNSTPRLSDLLKIVRANETALEEVTAHKDVTPINLLITDSGMVGLVDSDLAETTAPKYYDVAEFYNRLWTRVCRPDLAKKFLDTAINNLKEDENKFFHQLLTILAVRVVGNYWEIMEILKGKKNQKKRIKYLNSFADHVADKEFLR